MDLSSSNLSNAGVGTILRDATVKGLHAKVSVKAKVFFLYFRTKAGVERRPKLGEFPQMTVAQARQVAKEMMLEVAKGHDPMALRQAEREAPTVDQAIEQYEADYAGDRKAGKETVRLLRNHLGRVHGKDKVASIDDHHMLALHRSLRKTPILANRVMAHASKLFSLCERPWKYRTPAQGNPCRGVERYAENKRKRYMTPDEAKAVARELDANKAEYPAAVAYIYLLILVGARRGEIWNARWADLDRNVLRLPDSKTGAKPVYLPPAAMEVIDALPRTSGTITGISPPYKLWYKIRKAAGCPDLRLHDLRHSFASAGLSQGLSLAQIGELLGHASTQTTMRYAHLVEDAAHAAAAKTATHVAANMGK